MKKSNKQRRVEIKARRAERARTTAGIDPRLHVGKMPAEAIAADPARLAHNNTYGTLPSFYVDRAFKCRDCGSDEVWTAKQQKWWYEEQQGAIDSVAVRCRPCRLARRAAIEARGPAALRLRREGQALRELGARPPNAAARAALEEALASKWDGLNVIAARALCQWGDATSIARVRTALETLLADSRYRSPCGAIARTLMPHLGPADLQWAIDLLLEGAHRSNRFFARDLFEAFDPAALEALLQPLSSRYFGTEFAQDFEVLLFRARCRARHARTPYQYRD